MCADPNCPANNRPRPQLPDPRCICNKPIWISIPYGEHIHCPVHPEMILYGSSITY